MVSKKEYYEITNGTFLTSSEAALYLNAHINTVRRWEKQGLISAYRIGPRGDRRFQLEDLEKFVEAQRKSC